MFDWLTRHQLEVRLTLRMSAAGLISYALARLFGLAGDYWAVLTAVIVMQTSVGGSLKAMIDRFLGTVGGAAWGGAVASVLPHASDFSTGVGLAVALVPLAGLVGLRPALRVAPVTAVIVVLAVSDQHAILRTALDRVIEIGLGSVVALAVALLISPTRAHGMVRLAARDVLAAMGEQVRNLLADISVPPERRRYACPARPHADCHRTRRGGGRGGTARTAQLSLGGARSRSAGAHAAAAEP